MELKAGEQLILEMNESGKKRKHYRCRIADLDDRTIRIDYPIDEETGRTAFLENGTRLIAVSIHDDQPYRFQVMIRDRIRSRIPMLLLEYAGKDSIKKIQRREFVRIEANLDIAVHSPDLLFTPFVSLTSDIGGGGTMIQLPEHQEIPEGAEVQVWIVLPNLSGSYRYIRMKGKAVRVFTDKTGRKKASIQFLPENDRDRQPIVRFCFEKQLEKRKKMLDWQTGRYR